MVKAVYQPNLTPDTLSPLLAEWRTTAPQAGLFVLLPEAEKDQLGLLQALAKANDLPLMGAIFPALLTGEGFQQRGAILVQLDPCPPWILVEQLTGEQQAAGVEQIGEFIRAQLPELAAETKPVLFLVFDGLLPNINTVLFGLYAQLEDSTRYVGVNAGSETFQPMPCLFDANRCIDQGGIAMLLSNQTQFAVEHGYPTAESIFRATSAEGNRIDKINGRPALEIYQELVKHEFGIDITVDNFYQYAVHYPLGLVDTLEVLVRIPVDLTAEGGIHCVGEIPSNSVLKLLHAPSLEASQCIDTLATKLGPSASPLLTFYCAGRRMHFGEKAQSELRQLQAACQTADIFGALTLGEISTDSQMGFPEFHNAALVCARA